MVRLAGSVGETTALPGSAFNHVPPSNVDALPRTSTAPGTGVASRTFCEPGEDVPACRAKIRPVGQTRTPGLVPAGRTFNVNMMNWGELLAPVAEIRIRPLYCPAR